jgi:hypothetical protein
MNDKETEEPSLFEMEISEQDVVDIISSDIERGREIKSYTQVLIEPYIFEGFSMVVNFKSTDDDRILIRIDRKDKIFSKINNKPYNYEHYSEYFFKQKFQSIKEIISFLYTTFRKEYTYSKITDRIEKKTDLLHQEKKEMSYLMLMKNISFENIKTTFFCCVCLEPNFLLTKCNHCLCRKCYLNIERKKCDECNDEYIICDYEYKPCPICRGIL